MNYNQEILLNSIGSTTKQKIRNIYRIIKKNNNNDNNLSNENSLSRKNLNKLKEESLQVEDAFKIINDLKDTLDDKIADLRNDKYKLEQKKHSRYTVFTKSINNEINKLNEEILKQIKNYSMFQNIYSKIERILNLYKSIIKIKSTNSNQNKNKENNRSRATSVTANLTISNRNTNGSNSGNNRSNI